MNAAVRTRERVRTPEMVAEIKRLHATGLGRVPIAKALGIGESTVRRVLEPSFIAYEREYQRYRQSLGVCSDCGRDISSNRTYPASRCASCAAKDRVRRGVNGVQVTATRRRGPQDPDSPASFRSDG